MKLQPLDVFGPISTLIDHTSSVIAHLGSAAYFQANIYLHDDRSFAAELSEELMTVL